MVITKSVEKWVYMRQKEVISMLDNVHTYMKLLSMKDSGVRLNFQDITDDQLSYLCIEEDLIDSEIAYLYKVDVDMVKNRRYRAYLNKLHILQEKLLQDHFTVFNREDEKRDSSVVLSEDTREIIDRIHNLSNAELDQLLDYIIINNKRLSSTVLKNKQE